MPGQLELFQTQKIPACRLLFFCPGCGRRVKNGGVSSSPVKSAVMCFDETRPIFNHRYLIGEG
jgi:hypothetical protein